MLYVDRAIGQFWKQLALIIAVNGGHVDVMLKCSLQCFRLTVSETVRLCIATTAMSAQCEIMSAIAFRFMRYMRSSVQHSLPTVTVTLHCWLTKSVKLGSYTVIDRVFSTLDLNMHKDSIYEKMQSEGVCQSLELLRYSDMLLRSSCSC